MPEKNHDCQNGCGNVADVVVVNLDDSNADIVCMPCFLRLANDISQQFMENINSGKEALEIQEEVERIDREERLKDWEPGPQPVATQDGTALDLDTTPVPANPNLPEAFR